MEKNNDALRTLFSGLSADSLTAGDKADIMARVREQAARRENRFEWLMGAAAVMLLAAVAAALWIFAPDKVAGMLAKISIPDIFSGIKLPETSLHPSPMLILVAVCGMALLIFDRLIRNRYNKKHLTEL